MIVSIIGLGLIGGSVGKRLKEVGFADLVLGVDLSDSNCAKAVELGLVDETVVYQQAIQRADLVILAIPVDGMTKLLPAMLDAIDEGTTVMDLGSTKEQICQVVEGHENRKSFVAAHPIAGTENSGPEAAFSSLFDGKTGIICDAEKSQRSCYELAKSCLLNLGMHIIEMDSQSHDLHIAYVSHISHISSFILGQTVLEIEKNEANIFNLAGSGFASTVRLAKSSPQMWAPIFKQNKKHISKALGAYIDNLAAFKTLLDEGEEDAMISCMDNANEIRRVLKGIDSKKRTDSPIKEEVV
ncbi:prephenate dehydrogenase [Reichenbachiella agariperforans]|uniref:Prephenate dehydrogenase n=1 Tax=Reichenbachiella agariperforans TaxID=156994 RepID=A0A1M6KQL1_REIAG|nr:prephenate dehydrogenase [Reichenbachiella agariperforans]MBU2913651.1 prephenate dehydrogenase [Reichenbachiella agariperforans]SHJ61263.1 prephenate dehydrogenase [Reichenbachiella agariperforans]